MKTFVLKTEYKEIDGDKYFVVTEEVAKTKAEITRELGQLYYQLAAYEEQVLRNPADTRLVESMEQCKESIAEMQGYIDGFNMEGDI